jgi:tripartite-type tricarboxylate transporter receptor subunit TctC
MIGVLPLNGTHRAGKNTMKKTLAFLAMLFGAATFALATCAQAAGYPDHPVKIIVPFPAGGITDVVARLIAQHLSERLGQQFFVTDIGGAGGNIGMGDAARAHGDGYTLLFASSSMVVNPSLYKTVPYDIGKDFIPISKIGGTPNSWLANNSFPAQSMHDLVALLKANPGKYSVASPGSGTTASLSIEMLRQDMHLNFVVVPFTGGGPFNQSVLGGFTPIGCSAYGNTAPIILAGKVHTLAVASKTRLQALPNVPTLEEEGIKGEEAETMAGALAPAGTPAPIVQLLQKQIAEIVRLPDVQQKLLSFGIVPDGGSSADFATFIKDEVAKWKRVIEVGKIEKI